MNELKLVEPSMSYKVEYTEMIKEWEQTGEKMVPFVLRYDCSDFELFLQEMNRLKEGPVPNEKLVNSTTYWLVRSDRKVLGAVNIRHRLNEHLLEIGGHIGYGIRPGERRKGYATRLLDLALRKAREMGIGKVLVTCDKDNIGSARTIIRNGGKLASENVVKGTLIQRYWIG